MLTQKIHLLGRHRSPVSRLVLDLLQKPRQTHWQHRSYSDIKTNEKLLFSGGAATIVPSATKIKQSIRRGQYDFIDGPTSIAAACPICPAADESMLPAKQKAHTPANKCLFINKTTGDVVCPKCQHIFSFNVAEPFFRSELSAADQAKSRDLFFKSKPLLYAETYASLQENAVPAGELEPAVFAGILEHLDLHGIAAAAVEMVPPVLCDPQKKSLYFAMRGANADDVGHKELVRNPISGQVETITSPESSSYGVVTFAPSTKRGVRDTKTAIIVLTLRDALALRTEKSNVNIVCLPHGFHSLPQECLPALEQYQKLILWFDYNSVGWDMAKMFAKKLDEKRCHFIRPTESTPTPYVALQRSISMKSVLAEAQPILHQAVTTFRALRQDVLSDLQNIDKVEGIKWKRFPKLNDLLRGHRRGELTVFTGPTGCGKTTFMSEYSLDLAERGVKTLWGSFEIRNTILARTLLQQMARRPLGEHIDEFDKWANEFERLPMYFMTFYGQQPLKTVMEAIEHSQYVHDIHHVIIDNLQFMMGTSAQDRSFDKYWKQDEIISSFRTFASQRNCHVTLVIHPRKERADEDLSINSIFGSAKATQEADNVMILQDKRLLSVKGKKYLQVAKNRYCGDIGVMKLEFNRDALSFSTNK